MHERNGTSVPSVSSVFMLILTTDFQDLTDANHERKRDNPFNLCYLCSRKDKESTAARAVSPTYNRAVRKGCHTGCNNSRSAVGAAPVIGIALTAL